MASTLKLLAQAQLQTQLDDEARAGCGHVALGLGASGWAIVCTGERHMEAWPQLQLAISRTSTPDGQLMAR